MKNHIPSTQVNGSKKKSTKKMTTTSDIFEAEIGAESTFDAFSPGPKSTSTRRRAKKSETTRPYHIRHSTPVSNRNTTAIMEADRRIRALSPIPKADQAVRPKHEAEKKPFARKGKAEKGSSSKRIEANKPSSTRKREDDKISLMKKQEAIKSTSTKNFDSKRSISTRKGGNQESTSARKRETKQPSSTRKLENEQTYSKRTVEAEKPPRKRESEKSISSRKRGTEKESSTRYIEAEEPPLMSYREFEESSTRRVFEADEPWLVRHNTAIPHNDDQSITEDNLRLKNACRIPVTDPFGLSEDKVPTQHEVPGDVDIADNIYQSSTDDLDKKYIDLCKTDYENKKSILDKDTYLSKQDGYMEELMLISEFMSSDVSKKSKHLKEVKKVHDFIKAEEQKHRVNVKSLMIGAQMYTDNADKAQEDIWDMRKELAVLEYIQGFGNTTPFHMHAEFLKNLLIKEQTENMERERKIAMMENSFSKPDQESVKGELQSTAPKQSSKIRVDVENDRFVVRPHIHRRNIAVKLTNRDIEGKRVPAINAMKPLPGIAKQPEKVVTHQKQTQEHVLKDSMIKSEAIQPLPAIGKHAVDVDTQRDSDVYEANDGDTDTEEKGALSPITNTRSNVSDSPLCKNVFVKPNDPEVKMNMTEPLPAIGTESRSTDSSTSRVTSPEEYTVEGEPCKTPRPPLSKKSPGRFTRKNILNKLKSLIGK